MPATQPNLDTARHSHPVVEAEELVRAFGARRAVDGVSFTLGEGECLALFGPNGAGKTTLLRLLAGLLAPSAGSCRVAGVALREGRAVRAQVGLISHASMLYAALSARENVEFTARMYGLPDPGSAALRALTAMRVADRADAPVRALSRGLQQRVSIARAIVHEPRLLLCDEPYTGLDEVGSASLTTALAERRASGAALLLVTHNLGEGLALATHAAIMRRGRFVRFEARSGVDATSYASAYRDLVTADA
jgi:heme exporter protein A